MMVSHNDDDELVNNIIDRGTPQAYPLIKANSSLNLKQIFIMWWLIYNYEMQPEKNLIEIHLNNKSYC